VQNDALESIASRVRATPRTANYILKRIRDYAQVQRKVVDSKLVDEVMQLLEIDRFGLTEQDRKVWQSSCALLDVFKHMPVGEHANPGLELRNVPLIREKMQTFYTDLPDSATIVFTSTPYERAFMTAALEYGCLEQIVAADGKKDIRFASLMPMSDALSEEHGRNIPDINAVAEKLVGMMPKFGIPESYLEGAGGHRITNENDIG
jgi:hypothetical protein